MNDEVRGTKNRRIILGTVILTGVCIGGYLGYKMGIKNGYNAGKKDLLVRILDSSVLKEPFTLTDGTSDKVIKIMAYRG